MSLSSLNLAKVDPRVCGGGLGTDLEPLREAGRSPRMRGRRAPVAAIPG